jgi:class 3 adenylate cyclase
MQPGEHADRPLGRPFQLQRRFRRRVLPVLLLFVVVLVVSSGYAAREVFHGVYLELATRRAEGIAAGVERIAPGPWHALLDGRALDKADEDRLHAAIADEVKEFHLDRLKVYDLNGGTIFDTDPSGIGRIESGAALTAAARKGEPRAVVETTLEGRSLYELYVPYRRSGRVAAVFELYEPVGFLDGILLRAGLVAGTLPALFLIVLLVFLVLLVRRAQADIDRRTHEINTLRLRLAALVSRTAREAVETDGPGGPAKARRDVCTLLFTDLRNFTAFAEREPPERVIAILDRVLGMQIRLVERWGGDVDKILGDGLFARFRGRRAARRAAGCALAIQRDAARGKGESEPGIGIGIYTGPVVIGSMGSSGRRDFTTVGDSVNIAARLCGLARAGEIVCDIATEATSGILRGLAAESVVLKGREAPIEIARHFTKRAAEK